MATPSIDVEDYQTFIGDTIPDEKIAQCEAAIAQAIEWVGNQVGYPIVVYEASPSTATKDTQVFSGNGGKDFYPRYYPIQDVDEIGLWDGVDSYDAIDETLYLTTTDENRVYFESGDVFARGTNNWQIVYYYGWATAIPVDLKRAILHTVRMFMGVSTRDTSIQSQSDGEHSITYFKASDPQLPDEAIKIIAKYRRFATI